VLDFTLFQLETDPAPRVSANEMLPPAGTHDEMRARCRVLQEFFGSTLPLIRTCRACSLSFAIRKLIGRCVQASR